MTSLAVLVVVDRGQRSNRRLIDVDRSHRALPGTRAYVTMMRRQKVAAALDAAPPHLNLESTVQGERTLREEMTPREVPTETDRR